MEDKSNEGTRPNESPVDNAKHTLESIKAAQQDERRKMEHEAANNRAARRSTARTIIKSAGLKELENSLDDARLEKLDDNHRLLQRDWTLSKTGENRFRAMVALQQMDCRRRTI